MVLKGNGRMSRRSDGKYFLYLPKHVVEDSSFPFDLESSLLVRVIIDPDGERLLVIPLKASRPRRGKKR